MVTIPSHRWFMTLFTNINCSPLGGWLTLETNVLSFSAVTSACAEHGQWQVALLVNEAAVDVASKSIKLAPWGVGPLTVALLNVHVIRKYPNIIHYTVLKLLACPVPVCSC